MENKKIDEDVIRENLLTTNSLIKNLSRNLNLSSERLDYIEKDFKKSLDEMSIEELSLLNEMQLGTCLDQIV